MSGACQFDALTAGSICRRCGYVLRRDFLRGFYRVCPALPSAPAKMIDVVAAAGVDADRYAAFVREEGHPPGCYERACWWIKAFAVEFGAEAADRLRAELFGR